MYQQNQHTQVMFYIMPEHDSEQSTGAGTDATKSTNDYLQQACIQAAHYYRQNKRVFIFTEDQAQAHQIDQLLWSFEPDSFVPHNLIGEGPKQGAAIEIGYQPSTNRRPILINLAKQTPNFANRYQQIIDFVPSNEDLKQLARQRFRSYKQMGLDVQTQNAVSQQSTASSTNDA